MKFISLLLGLCGLVGFSFVGGCASTGETPTTQQAELNQALINLGLSTSYNVARLELVNAYNANKISPQTWVNIVAPAMTTAATDIQNYEADPSGTNLYSVANSALLTLTTIAESYLTQPASGSAPLPAPIPGPIVPVVTTAPVSGA